MTDIAATIEEAVARVAAGERASALAGAHLAALDRAGAELNAVARLEPDAAEAAADRLDRLPPEKRGPLHGAPLAHKDLYAREGWRLDAGLKLISGHRAEATGAALAGLDAAGALDLARLNTVEAALGGEGLNAHTGPVRNPWNPDHITGGSSSGSAAAVASGAVPAALGSDTGGSIRLPAAACGLIGLKPTAGLVGRSGVFALSGTLDTVGPLTRTVRDAALMLDALAGHDPADPQSVHRPPVDHLAGIEDGLAGLRIGIPDRYFFDPVVAEVGARLDAARDLLSAEGAEIREVATPGFETANRLAQLIISVEAAAQHAPWLATRASEYGDVTRRRLMPGLFQSAGPYLRALAHRVDLAKAALAGPFAEVDALFLPTWTREIPTIADMERAVAQGGQAAEDTGHCARPVNMLGFPAISVPCGLTANGLPTAFQLVGRPFSEPMLLRMARGFERAFGFWTDAAPRVRV
ncbi:MAG: amidase [Pseudomonadota bacterium]